MSVTKHAIFKDRMKSCIEDLWIRPPIVSTLILPSKLKVGVASLGSEHCISEAHVPGFVLAQHPDLVVYEKSHVALTLEAPPQPLLMDLMEPFLRV